MFAPRLAVLLRHLAVAGLTVDVAAVPNDFFGPKIAVAGLLTGQDIQRALARRRLGGRVLIPGVTLREQDGVFLDDLTPADLARDLDVPVQAVVRDVPGVTRDRLYGLVAFDRWQATFVDTGGFDPSPEASLVDGVRRQVLAALAEADLVLFVVDARAGLTGLDREIADALRKAGRPVLLVANKVEGPAQEGELGELYELGFGEPWPVSSEHGRGVAELLGAARARLGAAAGPFVEPSRAPATSIAIVGRPNVGKSSLVNALVGAERVLVHADPGTTRDAVDTPFTY